MNIFIKSVINLIKYLNINNSKKEFVFYSESKFYREHFIDLIENLVLLNQENVIFVTSDIEDYHFFKDKINCIFIGNFFILDLFFRILKCKFMIMTLTDLGSHLQKSKGCEKYIYFFHALASTHGIYTNTAFKNYDIILTNGEYQSKELIYAEKKFNFPKKEIINIGYFFLDYIKNKSNLLIEEKNHILFAPSWNYDKKNVFNDYGIKLINILLINDFKVTLRPHPEHFKREREKIKNIIKKFSDNKNFNLDKNNSNLDSLERSALVITDNSTIVLEFLLIFKRPILYFDYNKKIHNTNRSKIPIQTFEDNFKNIFGNIINAASLEKLPTFCKNLIDNKNDIEMKVHEFNLKNLQNFGNSSKIAAQYLIKIKNS